jgi:phosphatidylglycerophosphate synthase
VRIALGIGPWVNPGAVAHVRRGMGVRRGLAACATGLVVLLALLQPGAAGWTVGLTCGAVLATAAARRATTDGVEAFGPADLVTLTRATLACAVAGLVAASYQGRDVTSTLVPITIVALAMDFVDGRVARRTGTASAYGGRLDGEADAFLILVLSAFVAQDFGAWVLSMGIIRYAHAGATRLLPWMQRPLPPRYWRKVVAACVGIALTLAASGLAPVMLTWAVLGLAALLLAESFGWDVVWLARQSGRRLRVEA